MPLQNESGKFETWWLGLRDVQIIWDTGHLCGTTFFRMEIIQSLCTYFAAFVSGALRGLFSSSKRLPEKRSVGWAHLSGTSSIFWDKRPVRCAVVLGSYLWASGMMRKGVSRLLEGYNCDSQTSIDFRVVWVYLGQIPKAPRCELDGSNRSHFFKLWEHRQLFKWGFFNCLPQFWDRASYSKKSHIVYELKHPDDFSGTI